MSSSIVSRLAPVFAALGLLVFAGPAAAQFAECVQPSFVPEEVIDTIVEQASFDFGDLTDQVCDKITKKGVSTCKAQVKGSDKCFRRALDANYAIALKQCQQLEDSTERADCKEGNKSNRDEGRGEVEADKDEALALCEGDFADTLSGLCLAGVP